MTPVTTWAAGGTYSYTLEGTATHGGGSCQLAMSYDQGKSWQVIFSYIGGCMIEGLTTEFTLPSDAPNGEALFSWSWFNHLGNREMYQNCAVVTITNGGSGLSPSVYPTPFVANAGVNDCTTIEGQDVVFPEPGPNVRYGGSYAGGAPAPGTGIVGTNCYGPGESGGSTGSGSGSGSAVSSGAPAASGSASSGPAPSSPAASVGAPVPSASSPPLVDPSAVPSAWAVGSPSGVSADPAATPSATSQIGYEHAAQPSVNAPAPPAAAPTDSSGKTCRPRKRAVPAMHHRGHVSARRHERFTPRRMYKQAEREASGRVAALRAEHIDKV